MMMMRVLRAAVMLACSETAIARTRPELLARVEELMGRPVTERQVDAVVSKLRFDGLLATRRREGQPVRHGTWRPHPPAPSP